MLKFFEVAIGEGGPLSCSLCGSPTKPEPFGIVDIRAKLKAAAETAETSTERNVAFVGFEPFAHPLLPEIITAAAESRFDRIRIRTDAGALSLAGNAAGALSAGVRQFELVLLGERETHDRLTGREGLFAAAVAGLSAMADIAARQQSETFVSGVMPLCKHNVAVSPLAVAGFAEAGCRALELDASRITVDESTRRTLDAALDTATLNGIHAWVSGCDGFLAPYDRAPWTTEGADA